MPLAYQTFKRGSLARILGICVTGEYATGIFPSYAEHIFHKKELPLLIPENHFETALLFKKIKDFRDLV
jgi:hypothetical protein